MIDIYMTHYVTSDLVGYNDMAIETALWLRDVTTEPEFRLTIVYWTDSTECDQDLRERMPAGVGLVRNDRGERPGAQVCMMNKITDLAKAAGSEFFVQIHNDTRTSRGWLRNLVADLRAAEQRHGRGGVIISPHFIPYHWLDPYPQAYQNAEFWESIRPPRESKIISAEAMAEWCRSVGMNFDGRCVVSPTRSFTTDDGHQLMMYGAAPSFFDDVGPCDETFTGINYGDCEWGMRALKAGKKNLQSQGALVGHISGITYFNPKRGALESNHGRFIAKWGEDTFRALQDGSLWIHLHDAQGREGVHYSEP